MGPEVTTLVSLDGGNRKANDRACYAAEFRRGSLYWLTTCTLGDAGKLWNFLTPGDAVVVERPAFDGRIMRGVPPSTIIDLAWNVARVAYTLAAGAPVHEYTPGEWIGTVSKPVLQLRIWRALAPDERKCFPESTAADLERAAEHYARTRKVLQHAAFNTLDAAGVGLFHLGRIKKGGAKP